MRLPGNSVEDYMKRETDRIATVRCITMGTTHTGTLVELRPWRTSTGRISSTLVQPVIIDSTTLRRVMGEPVPADSI